jgi:hypothetical protein
MSRPIRLVLALAVLAALAFASVATTTAGGPKVLDTRLVGIPTGGLVLDGLNGGGVPWVLDEGHARLFADGRLQVEVEGLVLNVTPPNPINPIPNGRAVVTCSHVVAAKSPIVPFSRAGDGEVETVVNLPSPCLAPTVFWVGVTATGAEPWFAVSGF